MNEHLTEIVNTLAAQITEKEGRYQKRTDDAQAHFLHGLEHLIIQLWKGIQIHEGYEGCLLYTSPSPRDGLLSRMPSSA